MKRISLLILAFLFLNCTTPISKVEVAENPITLTLQQETRTGFQIEKGLHDKTVAVKGRYWITIGNPDLKQDLTSTINGESWVIPPATWAARVFEFKSLKWSLEVDQSAFLSLPCLLGQKEKDKKNVLLISVDTLRADYFNPTDMPKCYRFFSEGAIFEKTYSPVPWTLPAHASLFTSLYPSLHGVRKPEDRLGPEHFTLADSFAEAGYFTLAVTEGNYLDPMYGLSSGFYSYFSVPPKLDSSDPEEASRLADNIETLKAKIEDPTLNEHFPIYAFLHTYEVHCPFLPRNGCTTPAEKGTTKWLLEHEISGFSKEDVSDLKNLYASEVRYTDDLLYKFISSLDPETWIISLVSDHGEEFGEHGGLLHADTLFEEVLRVPMAIRGNQIKPEHISRSASLLDVAPTLAVLSGLEPHHAWQGLAWFNSQGAIIHAQPGMTERSYISESYFFGPHIPSENPRLLGINQGNNKLIQQRNFEKFDAWYFDLGTDPGEQKNLLEENPNEVQRLFPFLEAYSENNSTSLKAGEMTEEQAELMRSLGYSN